MKYEEQSTRFAILLRIHKALAKREQELMRIDES